jgi:hypothetical protein
MNINGLNRPVRFILSQVLHIKLFCGLLSFFSSGVVIFKDVSKILGAVIVCVFQTYRLVIQHGIRF